jgi:hypothetical protein
VTNPVGEWVPSLCKMPLGGLRGESPASSLTLTRVSAAMADCFVLRTSLAALWAPPELLSTTTGAPWLPPRIFETAPATRDAKSGPKSRKSLSSSPFGCRPPLLSAADGVVVEEGGDVSVGDVSPVVGDSESASAGRAYATPGVVATAAPTPNATASAPT